MAKKGKVKRNESKCKTYAASGKLMLHREEKLRTHIKSNPNDDVAKAAIKRPFNWKRHNKHNKVK